MYPKHFESQRVHPTTSHSSPQTRHHLNRIYCECAKLHSQRNETWKTKHARSSLCTRYECSQPSTRIWYVRKRRVRGGAALVAPQFVPSCRTSATRTPRGSFDHWDGLCLQPTTTTHTVHARQFPYTQPRRGLTAEVVEVIRFRFQSDDCFVGAKKRDFGSLHDAGMWCGMLPNHCRIARPQDHKIRILTYSKSRKIFGSLEVIDDAPHSAIPTCVECSLLFVITGH